MPRGWSRRLAAEEQQAPNNAYPSSAALGASGAMLVVTVGTCSQKGTLGAFQWFVLSCTFRRGYGWCPYYAARGLIQASSVVVLNYQQLPEQRFCAVAGVGGMFV